MRRITEQDEFLLSQLLDGELADAEASQLRERMAREPELRAAYEALARVDGALAARRGTMPAVNWAQFHQRVMAEVREDAEQRSVIRFPQWVKYAVPIAMAAAIALVFALRDPLGHAPQPGQPIQLAQNPTPAPEKSVPDQKASKQAGDARPQLAVHYSRPTGKSKSVITVSYKQSTQLAQEMQARDKERRSRPTSHLFLAGTMQVPHNGSYEELPPL